MQSLLQTHSHFPPYSFLLSAGKLFPAADTMSYFTVDNVMGIICFRVGTTCAGTTHKIDPCF